MSIQATTYYDVEVVDPDAFEAFLASCGVDTLPAALGEFIDLDSPFSGRTYGACSFHNIPIRAWKTSGLRGTFEIIDDLDPDDRIMYVVAPDYFELFAGKVVTTYFGADEAMIRAGIRSAS